MKSLRNKIYGIAGIALALGMLAAPLLSRAQSTDAMALTITPPFFEINANPGDGWSSSIRVVNTNPTDLTVHATVVGFGASDDLGHGTFIDPTTLASDTDALSNWIILSSPSVTIPRGSAGDLPFTIAVPYGASPGGHYAAILIGTTPLGAAASGSYIGVSSYISALVFVNISGNVIEQGSVQQFSTDHSYYEKPNVNFTVEFQNTGNTHTRPQGDIQIYNAFGKEQADLPINQQQTLGYVLPSSSRIFTASWSSPGSLLDIGQYTAVVTLTFGSDKKQSVSDTITFWILPIWNILEVLFGVLAAAAICVFFLKRVVRGLLAKEMARYGPVPPSPPGHPRHPAPRRGEEEVVDLRNGRKGTGR